ncbi:MAG TPA: hypothetical protein VFN56_00995 [Candidatus Saccharimonadales bacterium]|nr:hypothetical protein [Candidatus Saccharimonadales bacterium]
MPLSEFRNNMQELKSAAAEDWHENTPFDKITAAATLGGVALHETSYEGWAVKVGTAAFLASKGNPLVTGAAMMGFSGVVETSLTYGVTHTSQKFSNATQKFFDIYMASKATREQAHQTRSRVINAGKNVLWLFGLGSPGVIANNMHKNPDNDPKQTVRIGSRARNALMGINFSIGAGLAEAGPIGKLLGTDTPTHIVNEAVRWPYTSWSVLITVVGLNAVGHMRNVHRARNNAEDDQSAPAAAITQGEVNPSDNEAQKIVDTVDIDLPNTDHITGLEPLI